MGSAVEAAVGLDPVMGAGRKKRIRFWFVCPVLPSDSGDFDGPSPLLSCVLRNRTHKSKCAVGTIILVLQSFGRLTLECRKMNAGPTDVWLK